MEIKQKNRSIVVTESRLNIGPYPNRVVLEITGLSAALAIELDRPEFEALVAAGRVILDGKA